MNHSYSPPPGPPLEATAPFAQLDTKIAWRPLLLRMFVVIPPAQVLGIVVGLQLLIGTGLLQREHWLSAGISVIGGALSGLAIGFLLTPTVPQRRTFALVAAAFAVATSVLLAVLTEVRLANWGVEPYWFRYALGTAIVMGVQTLVALRLWISRAASNRPRASGGRAALPGRWSRVGAARERLRKAAPLRRDRASGQTTTQPG
jgi:hypothetical protein